MANRSGQTTVTDNSRLSVSVRPTRPDCQTDRMLGAATKNAIVFNKK